MEIPNPDSLIIVLPSTALCFKCKKKVEISNPEHFITKGSPRHAVKGNCPHCSGKVVSLVHRNEKLTYSETEASI